MSARHVLAYRWTVIAKDTTHRRRRRDPSAARRPRGAIKARSAAPNALTGLIVTAPEPLRVQLKARKTTRGQATLCARLRPDHARLAEPEPPRPCSTGALRSIARRVVDLGTEIAGLDRQLKQLVAGAAPATTSPDGGLNRPRRHAAGLRRPEHRPHAQRGRVRRAVRRQPHPRVDGTLRPSSPQLRRRSRRQPCAAHDRRLPTALLPAHPHLRRTPHRPRQDQNRNHPLLKRYIAREIYHALLADLRPTPSPRRRRDPIVSITCGAGPIGQTIRTA